MMDSSQSSDHSNATVRLIKLILDLTDEQVSYLLKQAEEMVFPTSTENERNSARKPFRSYINFSLGDRSLWGLSKDISGGGMFIETKDEFNVGDVLEILLPHPKEDKSVEVPAKVVRSDLQGIGVEFMKKINNVPKAVLPIIHTLIKFSIILRPISLPKLRDF